MYKTTYRVWGIGQGVWAIGCNAMEYRTRNIGYGYRSESMGYGYRPTNSGMGYKTRNMGDGV